MATVNRTIDVEVPVSVAYNQWTQFESFPEFMKGVEAVEQIDETALHFSTNVGGVKRGFNAQILEQVPDSLVSWASVDGPRNAGTVSFEPLGADRTRVSVEIEWEPEGFAEKAGSMVGIDDMRVSADLDKFKKFIEERGYETGAWRGSVAAGDVDDSGSAATPVEATSELPAVDPDLTAPAAMEAADGGDATRVGQYTEGDYGTERVADLPAERIEGDYTTEETPRDPSVERGAEAWPATEAGPGTETGPRPSDR
ncbi:MULTISPECIES: SRPBCC family protein [Arthrobacter]|uniref:Carbon monoxide dehydrogenase subunit G n=1 Tax=Arthrobacter bambusae TaxID=1338426 RepID=A0AAW8D8I8_9MICC|nr:MULTISPECIES: SRPBCC family protein [Arthrobacter]MDP9904133.1 carbon monoxide dehydrogenase subunit G [Arthrobacter bambusae]MDQ0127871.1 carbon monoxide dehydrogenase subunit G [Arthrobacter bambusae]MDQ0179213.1 carbon monoxide dehydrogenase subunit G [Arthrobacter bambusae]MDQ0240674.1 carbon monoxide dehydrogenase subunit G [Arthrobacter bambusae]